MDLGLERLMPTGIGAAYRYRAWALAGRPHAFFGVGINQAGREVHESWPALSEALGIERLLLTSQVHGTNLIEISSRPKGLGEPGVTTLGEADGIVVHYGEPSGAQDPPARPFAIGVRTADCLPVLLCGPNASAVVHAGWRGLAAGILERALIAMGCASDNQGPIHVLVGPCAGADRYEVGPEVLQALGPSAVYRDASRGHYLLDLQETLVQRIKRIESDIRVDLVKLCTISSPEFYSYRRQGAEAGRNLTVLVVD